MSFERGLFLCLNVKIDGQFVQRIMFDEIEELERQAEEEKREYIKALKYYLSKDAINLDKENDEVIYLPSGVSVRNNWGVQQEKQASPFLGLRVILMGIIISFVGYALAKWK